MLQTVPPRLHGPEDEATGAARPGGFSLHAAVAGALAVPLFGKSPAPLARPAFARHHGIRRAADLARIGDVLECRDLIEPDLEYT